MRVDLSVDIRQLNSEQGSWGGALHVVTFLGSCRCATSAGCALVRVYVDPWHVLYGGWNGGNGVAYGLVLWCVICLGVHAPADGGSVRHLKRVHQ
jgi:hypothetical protein